MLESRARVREMFEGLTDDLDEINLPLIADEVTQQIRDDPELIAAFLDEHLRPMVYAVGFSVLSSQRANQHRVDAALRVVQSIIAPASGPSTPKTRGRLLRASQKDRGSFAWLRQPLAIASGRQIRLEAARRPDLALALQRQVSRLLPARQRMMHYALMHDELPDDNQAVGDVLDDARIAELWVEAQRRVEAQDRANTLAEATITARRRQARLPAP